MMTPLVHLTNVQRIATLAGDDPDAIYRPVQDGLRAAGRYLDTHACRLGSLSLTDYSIVLTLAPSDVQAPDRASLRARLRVVGQYLDERAARALVLQEHAGGCYVAFSGLEMESRTMDVIRVTEMLDAAHVEALLARSEAS
jgi:hypothetical protein